MARVSGLPGGIGLAILLAAASPSIAQESRCPATQGSHRLSGVSVFDGPPSEQADLVPDTISRSGDRSQWEIAYLFKLGRRVFVQCRYAKGDAAVVFEAGKAVQTCTFGPDKAGGKALICR